MKGIARASVGSAREIVLRRAAAWDCPAAFPVQSAGPILGLQLLRCAHPQRYAYFPGIGSKYTPFPVPRGQRWVARRVDRWPATPARRRLSCPSPPRRAPERTFLTEDAGQRRGGKRHFTAVFDDPRGAISSNYILEDIRADVRLRPFWETISAGSTVRSKDFFPAHCRTADHRCAVVQLAVRVGAGAASPPELDYCSRYRAHRPSRTHGPQPLSRSSRLSPRSSTSGRSIARALPAHRRRTVPRRNRGRPPPDGARAAFRRLRNDDFRYMGFITHEGHLQFFRKNAFFGFETARPQTAPEYTR